MLRFLISIDCPWQFMKISAQEHAHYIVSTVEGSLTNESLAEFESFLGDTLNKHKHLVLDLSRLSFVLSSGLSAMLSFNNSMHQRGLRFIVCGMNNELQKLFSITGILSRLDTSRTPEEAVAELSDGLTSSKNGQL